MLSVNPVNPSRSSNPLLRSTVKILNWVKRYSLSRGCRRRTSFLVTLAITSRKVVLITYQAQLVTNEPLARLTHLRCLIQIWISCSFGMDEQKIRKSKPQGLLKCHFQWHLPTSLLVDTLQSIPQYREWFQQIHGNDNITIDNVTFEKTLRTPTRHLIYGWKRTHGALTKAQVEGYQLFKPLVIAEH